MAFSAAQIVQIKKYLGFPQVFESDNYRLMGAIQLIGADATKQAYVESILTELATVDAAIAAQGASGATYGALKKVDEVEFYSPKESSTTTEDLVSSMKRGRMLCSRLSSAVGVPKVANYFGTHGYADDSWAGADFQVGAWPLG